MCKIILLKYHVLLFLFSAKLQCPVNEHNILHLNEVKFLKIKIPLTFLTVFSTQKKKKKFIKTFIQILVTIYKRKIFLSTIHI